MKSWAADQSQTLERIDLLLPKLQVDGGLRSHLVDLP